MPAYWLLKSEPETWSWEDQVKKGVESWDGVRNFLAQKNMRAMKIGDLCFFYHSVKEKAIVGIVKVCREIYPDPSDESGKHGMVDVEAVKPLVQPVTLADLKADPVFTDLVLLRQSRLSVVPLEKKHWDRINELGSVKREEEPKKPRKRAKKKEEIDTGGGEETGPKTKDGTAGEEGKEGAEDQEGASEARRKKASTNTTGRKRPSKSKAVGAKEPVAETQTSSGKKAPKKRKAALEGGIESEIGTGTELKSKTVKNDAKSEASGRRSGRLKAQTA